MPLVEEMKIVLELVKDLPPVQQRVGATLLSFLVTQHEEETLMTARERAKLEKARHKKWLTDREEFHAKLNKLLREE